VETLTFSGPGLDCYELAANDGWSEGMSGSAAAAVVRDCATRLLEHPDLPAWASAARLAPCDGTFIARLTRELQRGRASDIVLHYVEAELIPEVFPPRGAEVLNELVDEPIPLLPEPEPETTFIAIRIVDELGRSFAGTPIRVVLPDGSEQTATLDDQSGWRADDIEGSGKAKFFFDEGLQRNDDVEALEDFEPGPLDASLQPADRKLALAMGSEHTAVVEVPTPGVVIFDTGGLCFGTDREILVPAYHREAAGLPNHHCVTGLDVIRAVIEHARKHPEQRVCVVGHTDTVGSDTSNLELSERRAESVRLFLAGDREGWAALATDNQTVADWQLVLTWAHLVMGMNCDPGEVDDDLGKRTQSALHRFRANYNDRYGGSLAIEGPFVAADWGAVFDCYVRNLAEQFGLPGQLEAPLSDVALGEPAVLACGEAFPAESPAIDGRESARNRRVEIVFFDPDKPPTFDVTPTPTGIYGAQTKCRRTYGTVAPSDYAMARFELQTAAGEPHEDHTCQLLLGDTVLEAIASANGYVEFVVPAAPADAILVISDAQGTQRQERPIHLGALAPVDEDAGVQGRLSNLGFDVHPSTSPAPEAVSGAVSAFQDQCEIPPTGEVCGETRDALALHHGC